MTSSNPPPAPEEASRLEAAVEIFAQAWDESAFPPDLAEHLARVEPALLKEVAPELIKLDLERRWTGGLRRFLEDYIDDVPSLRNNLSAALIFEEYHIRKLAGDEFTVSEYFERFPEQADDLRELFRVDPQLRSTLIPGAAPSLVIDLAPGESVDDFDLLLKLGQGVFATVFLARQRSMQRLVAVKVSGDKGDEPQTLAQFDHDNIVRVYDQRTVPERGFRLLYMQYAAGGTLADVIAAFRRIPIEKWSGRQFVKAIDTVLDAHGETAPAESTVRRKLVEMSWPEVVCWLGAQLARALDYAHRAGVLHRDLKPANVLLTAEGVPKLADFNISFSSKIEGSTPETYFGGSLAYMSPEQLEACNPRHAREAGSLDGRSDLFSLGVLLCELLTGERPFDDNAIPVSWSTRLEAMIEQRLAGLGPEQSRQFLRQETPGLDEILVQSLAANLHDRFTTGLEFANELELCLQPDARRLLAKSTHGWKAWARQWPVFSIVLVTVIPNLVGAVFNYLYNKNEVLRLIPDAEPTFEQIQTIINLIAFPAGMACAGWLAGSVGRATRNDERAKLSPTALAEQRRRCLNLGNQAVLICLTLWLLAAPAYPISLHHMLGSVPLELYGHFVGSLVLCGLIAAAYPFFGVSIVAVRAFYPSLLKWDTISPQDVKVLQRLSRLSWVYLILAASVPMVAVLILVLCGLEANRFALMVLATGGVIGFVIAVSAFRMLQADIAILTRLLKRSDNFSVGDQG